MMTVIGCASDLGFDLGVCGFGFWGMWYFYGVLLGFSGGFWGGDFRVFSRFRGSLVTDRG